jgi:signal transduction histidine kinase
VHPEDRQGMRDILEKAAQGEEDTSFENRVVAADGRSLQVQWSISMQVEGKVLAIGRDVTKSRQAEAKLSSYAKNLERSLDELDQFAYVVSHDLKTPLRGIYSLADFIEEDLEAGDRKAVGEHLDLLKNRVDRMQNLIMGVLAYSRAGKDLNERRPIPLGHFLQDVIDSMAIPEGFSVHFPSELPTVRFNPTKLQQVLQNLLSNACKYNGSDSGRVEIDCREVPGFWQLSVTDDGPGIPQRYHEQVFLMFRTLQSRDKIESTGIGLPIVKKIVEEAGGQVFIDPAYQEGTRVVFTIRREE